MRRIGEEEIKELFAEWGLWSLVEDISDDGDGEGDALQLTKEGLEAHRMVEELLEEKLKIFTEEELEYLNACIGIVWNKWTINDKKPNGIMLERLKLKTKRLF